MSRPHRTAVQVDIADEAGYAPEAVRLEEVDVLACVYGPGTSAADMHRMDDYGAGWERAVRTWLESAAPYCLLVAARPTEARCSDRATFALANPIVILANDERRLRSAIWSAMRDAHETLCILESFEPALDDYIAQVKAAALHAPGHA